MIFSQLYSQLPKSPVLWSISEVALWLEFIKMKPFVPNFVSIGVDGSVLQSLEIEDLENELGITSGPAKRKLMKWFKQTLREFQHYVETKKNQHKNILHELAKTTSISSATTIETQQYSNPHQKVDLMIRPYEDSQEIFSHFYKLKDDDMTVGRSNTCHMVIREQTVSGSHARIWKEGNKFYIQDTGSKNGTFIKTRERQYLEVGYIIEMGSYLFQVKQIHQSSMVMLCSRIDHQDLILNIQINQNKNSYKIGRNPENDLYFVDSHLSGRHAKIYLLNGKFVIEDLDSTNGTWRRLSKSNTPSQPQRLHNRTIFKIGNSCCYKCSLGANEAQSFFKTSSNHCLICKQQKVRDGVALSCKHLIGCFQCLLSINSCLICGTKIADPIKIYS